MTNRRGTPLGFFCKSEKSLELLMYRLVSCIKLLGGTKCLGDQPKHGKLLLALGIRTAHRTSEDDDWGLQSPKRNAFGI